MLAFDILVWEEEVDHADLLTYNLNKAGFNTQAIESDDILFDPDFAPPDMLLFGSSIDDQLKADICRQIQSLPSFQHTRVICLTTDEDCWERINHTGVRIDACIILPTKPKKIVKLIRQMLLDPAVCSEDSQCDCAPNGVQESSPFSKA